MSSISKRSAASRKAWRTRKKMKAARRLDAINALHCRSYNLFDLERQREANRARLPNPFMEIK